MAETDWLAGIHAVQTALEQDARHLHRILLAQGKRNPRLHKLLEQAETRGIPVETCPPARLQKLAGNPHHQGVLAEYQPPAYLDETALLEKAANQPNSLLLALDGVTDPGNLGACLRSADAAGVAAVILPKDRAVAVTPTVRKRAAGAADQVPIARVTNLARTLEQLQKAGFWVAGAAGEGSQSLYDQPLSLPLVLVMGSEGKGLRPGVRKRCDWLLHLPMHGVVESLNVSVATGIFLYEILRQTRQQAG